MYFFLRFIFTVQSICCRVLLASFVFLPSYIGFTNLSHWTSFFWGTCIHGTITFSESRGLFIVVIGITYGWEFIFPNFTVFGKLKYKTHQMTINQTFEENMSREALSVLIPLC